MGERGFTLIEIFTVIVIIGIVVLVGLPRIRDAMQKTNVRSARVAAGTYVVTARAAAIQRGAKAVVHFSSSAGTVWITAAPRMATTGSGTVDTIGAVSKLAKLYSVTMTETRDSVQFDARGLSMDNAVTTTVRFTASSGAQDSIIINQVGKVVR